MIFSIFPVATVSLQSDTPRIVEQFRGELGYFESGPMTKTDICVCPNESIRNIRINYENILEQLSVEYPPNCNEKLLWNKVEQLIKLKALMRDFLFVHSMAVDYLGKGLLFSGGIKTGKTKLLIELLRREALLISDDFTIISTEAIMHSYPPQKMDVASYHFKLFPKLNNELSLKQRVQLSCVGILIKVLDILPETRITDLMRAAVATKDVVYLDIDRLYDVTVQKTCSIDSVFFIRQGEKFEVNKLSLEQCINKVIASTLTEHMGFIKDFLEYNYEKPVSSNAMDFVLNIGILARVLLERGLSKAKYYELSLPGKFHPRMVIDDIQNIIGNNDHPNIENAIIV